MAARARFWRLAIRIAVIVLLAPLPPILYLSHFGFPAGVTRRLVAAADANGYCLEMKGMRLNVIEGIVIDGPRLFEKGVIGPPLLEAAEVTVGFRLLGVTGSRRICRVTVKNGTLRPGATGNASRHNNGDKHSPFPALDLQVVLENCDIQNLQLPHFSCDVSARAPKLRLENIHAQIGHGERTGSLTGEVTYNSANRRFTGHTSSDFDPNDLVRFISTHKLHGVVSLIQSFEFPGLPPSVETRFTGCAGTNFALSVDGKVKARDFRRYGLDVRRAESQVTVKLGGDSEFVALCPLIAARDDGSAEVDLTIDLLHNTVSFIGTGNADPRAVMRAINPATSHLLDDYHIGGPTRYSARGFLSVTNLDICNIEVTGEAKQFGLPQFVADECSFTFLRAGRTVTISNLQARAFDGKLSGTLFFEPQPGSTNTSFSANITVDKFGFRKFAQALTKRNDLRQGLDGILSGEVAVNGVLGSRMEHTFNGRGNLRIRDGNLFQLPIFGQLSGLLAEKIPGVAYVLRQNSATASFDIIGGKVKTDALRIEGEILSLKANGSYDLQSEQLDFDVELRFLKKKTWAVDILQTIMLPITKLFRVRLQGRIDDPKWESVNF
ncbi:MAG: AsmA-like C-terminal region-containing protein [bacterium]